MTPNLKHSPRVAIIGQGAREHAIAWKLAQSTHQPVLYSIPGNPGMWDISEAVHLNPADQRQIVEWAKEHDIDFAIVGPEQPLAEGLVDAFALASIPAFGPTKAAAQLEASKSFAKELMQRTDVPTARFATFTEVAAAQDFASSLGYPVVIKADGLAAGKGVIIAADVKEADAAIADMLEGNRFGDSGHKVVVEEFLTGEEVSLMYFVDGKTAVPMLPARDFKRIGEGDTGPNTGGMGAFCPVPSFIESGWTRYVTEKVVQPVLDGLAKDGIVYRGVLYAGLMVTAEGPKVIEFNARFGDPETEVVLPLLATDLLDITWAVAHGDLSKVDIAWHDRASVCVILASRGYPATSDKGTSIDIGASLSDAEQAAGTEVVFHAGTSLLEGKLVTAGGRVLAVSATGKDILDAKMNAYNLADTIRFKGMQIRRDIAYNWQR